MAGGYSINNNGGGLLSYNTNLSYAQILLSNNPIQLLPAPGVGKTYNVYSIISRLNFNSIDYTVNNILAVGYPSATVNLFLNNYILSSTVTRMNKFSPVEMSGPTNVTQMLENQALYIYTLYGNPVGGNSSLDLYMNYEIQTL